ncbi:Major urinary protein 4 [Microtus ochrogaster]|uniref:Major urinary protein 4 n=1 Tax=Microtus ochrogaster TaxID=79684 RepID=A0A8J6GV21_MICOH|nr:Major urinary protein 4 [Microtus ochrogaster]
MKLLLLLLLGLELTLVCIHTEEQTGAIGKSFTPEKIEGKWYSVGLASDKREIIEEHGSMRIFVEHIHVFKNSSLAFHFHTVTSKRFSLFPVEQRISELCSISSTDDGDNIFNVLATDYDGYIIFHLRNINNGETFQLMELYGRKTELSSNIKEKFVDLCKKHGIVEENILDLTGVGIANQILQLKKQLVSLGEIKWYLIPECVLVLTLQIAVSRPEMEERLDPPGLAYEMGLGSFFINKKSFPHHRGTFSSPYFHLRPRLRVWRLQELGASRYKGSLQYERLSCNGRPFSLTVLGSARVLALPSGHLDTGVQSLASVCGIF